MKFFRSNRFPKCQHDPRRFKWLGVAVRRYLIPTHDRAIKTERVWFYTPFGYWFVEWGIICYTKNATKTKKR